MKKMKRFMCMLLAACLMTGLLAGCTGSAGGSASSASPSASGAALTEVKWVSPAALASLDFCWLYVADAMGYLADEGIKLDVVECTDGSDAKYLASGSADFGGFSPAVGLSSADAGAGNYTAVCNIVVNNIFGLAYKKGGSVSDWSDLSGKNIAALAESWPSLFNPILEAAKVDPKSVNYVVYGPAEYEALNSGNADAMGTWISEYYMCVGMGYDDWGYLNGNDVLPQIANSLWVNNDFAKAHPELVKGFVRALTKASYFCYLNPEAAADITLNKFPEIEITWEGAVGAVKGNVCGMIGATTADQEARVSAHKIGVFDMDTVKQTITNLYNGGSISKMLDAATYYTNDFVDTSWDYAAVKADSDGYQFGSKLYTKTH